MYLNYVILSRIMSSYSRKNIISFGVPYMHIVNRNTSTIILIDLGDTYRPFWNYFHIKTPAWVQIPMIMKLFLFIFLLLFLSKCIELKCYLSIFIVKHYFLHFFLFFLIVTPRYQRKRHNT